MVFEQELEEIQEKITEENKPNFIERFWFVLVILAVIVVGGLGVFWVFNQRLITPRVTPTSTLTPTPTSVIEIDATTAALEQLGTSDEISSIEADIEATDLSGIDKELIDIEAELSLP